MGVNPLNVSTIRISGAHISRRRYEILRFGIQYVSERECHKEQVIQRTPTRTRAKENKGRRSPRSGLLKLALHSRYAMVVVPRGEFVRQFVHHISIYHGVQILA